MSTCDFHGDAELAPGLVDLAVNVRAGTPPAWLRAVLHRSLDAAAAYPDAGPARAAVAAAHGRPPEEVLLAAGAAEVFVLVARALRPRRAVVVHPSFTEPRGGPARRRAPGRAAACCDAPGYRLDPAAVPADADLVVLGNPTNPTSVLHPADDRRRAGPPGPGAAGRRGVRRHGRPASPSRWPAGATCRACSWSAASPRRGGWPGCGSATRSGRPTCVAALAAAQPHWPVSTPALAALDRLHARPAARAEAARRRAPS